MTDDLKLTPKQEKFCLKYIETGNATEAYYAAYDAEGSKPITANRRAKELLDNSKIAARVRALQAMHVERHIVTVDSITTELEEARQIAITTKQSSAAVSASLGKAKLHGLIVDKGELTGKDGAPIQVQPVQIYIPDNGRGKD
jgi:phage terminase small subunit